MSVKLSCIFCVYKALKLKENLKEYMYFHYDKIYFL